mgnify:CR=1 FL=1
MRSLLSRSPPHLRLHPLPRTRPAADDVATVAFAAVAMNPADDAALGKGVSAAKTKTRSAA